MKINKIICDTCQKEIDTDSEIRLDIMKKEKRGSLYTLTIRGGREETINFFSSINTVFYEVLPLSLEEIFISETEVVGYDIQKLILG